MRRADRERLDRLADALEEIGVEFYRTRIALEVLAGDALERRVEGGPDSWMSEHPAGAELRHVGRLGDVRPPGPFG